MTRIGNSTVHTAYVTQGEIDLRNEHYAAAAHNFTAALARNPHDGRAYFLRGRAYAGDEQYRYDQVIAEYRAALTHGYTQADVYFYLGVAYHCSYDEAEQAIANYTHAIARNPTYVDAYFNRGLAYFDEVGDCERAIADFTQLIALSPTNDEAYYMRGWAHRAHGAYGAAIADFTHAIKVNPANLAALYHRGETYKQMGRRHEAVTDFEAYIQQEADPGAQYWAKKALRELGVGSIQPDERKFKWRRRNT